MDNDTPAARYRRKNRAMLRGKQQQYNEDVPKRMHYRIKSRAKRQGIPYNLDPSDYVIPDVCPVLGIKIEPQTGKGKGFHNNSPSCDRIDPDGGYMKGNVRIISARANLLKSNATVRELELVLADLRRIADESV